jgi:hypothetical protein
MNRGKFPEDELGVRPDVTVDVLERLVTVLAGSIE